jgi:ABC-type iron transport system FetAB ATPase subunit
VAARVVARKRWARILLRGLGHIASVLRIEKLKIGGVPPLSFEVRAGECLAIEGPSGSGKTRLLRAIADLDPAVGQVFLEGAERGEDSAMAWRRQVRYCAAEPAWWAERPRDHLPAASGEKLGRLLRSLGLDEGMLDQPVAGLSTGERLRLGLLRSLIDEPCVLLLDEPTAALDGAAAALVEELIRYLMLSGRVIVLVSHDEGQIERLAHIRLLLAPSPAPAARAKPRSAQQSPRSEIRL